MKSKIKLLIAMLFISITTMAQSPNMINYQGVANNANGTAIANQAIQLRFSIHNSTAAGNVQYSEVRNATTDASGLFNVQIGAAGALSTTGTWGAINWKNGAKYLQVEMDPTGGTTYINMGTQQLVSVPYAQYAKEAGSLIPTATITPSQIATTGATSNQVLQFNGTNWIPSTIVSGNSFALPYITTDANLISFQITNSNVGASTAVYGKSASNNINANGVLGETTAANGNGVHGKAANTSAVGVWGENTQGYGVKGTTSSYTSSSTAGVYGLVTGSQGNGVLGVANFANGTGVNGSSTTGIGIKGYSNSNAGVFGSSLTGTALYGTSYTGYGLQVDGKVKISGGNTNPANGAVLVSDAVGNATWQTLNITPKISFRASGSNVSFPPSMYTVVNFQTQEYDNGNCYDPATYTFTAPVNGIYNFTAHTGLHLNSSVYNMENVQIELRRSRNGVLTNIAANRSPIENLGSAGSRAHVFVSTDVKLQAGDQVYVVVFQYSTSSTSATTQCTSVLNNTDYFTGHIINLE